MLDGRERTHMKKNRDGRNAFPQTGRRIQNDGGGLKVNKDIEEEVGIAYIKR
jgi:hypothetical protein